MQLNPRSFLPASIGRTAYLCGFAALSGLLVWLSLTITQNLGQGVILWPVNGFIIAILITLPRREWPLFAAAAYGANVAAALLYGDAVEICLPLCLCNLAEAIFAAYMLRRGKNRFSLSRLSGLQRFAIFGMVLPPVIFGLIAAALVTVIKHAPFITVFYTWTLADILGIGIVVPVVLNLLRGDWHDLLKSGSFLRSVASLVIFTFILVLVFDQTRYPLLFLIPPFLLVVMTQTGIAGISIAVPALTVIALEATLRDSGPFAINRSLPHEERLILLQTFILCCLILGSWGTLLLEDRRHALRLLQAERERLAESEKKLGDSEALHRLMSENSRDIIICSNLSGVRRYVSPAVEEILGWTPADFIGHHWREFAHPEDITALESMMGRMKNGTGMETATYRYRTKSGDYCWVEGHVRLIRDPQTGEPLEFIGNIRDITRRKEAEEKLAAAYAEMEQIAATDGLTGIANRRQFDIHLEQSWRRAQRDSTPVALLLIDADKFKAYNDHYGHLKGDDVLRMIGEYMKNCVNRLDDLAARYGGEEFALLLPSTSKEGAIRIAEALRQSIALSVSPHVDGIDGIVTVSIGVAVMHPARDQFSSLLVSAADTALYQAKTDGRNRTVAF